MNFTKAPADALLLVVLFASLAVNIIQFFYLHKERQLNATLINQPVGRDYSGEQRAELYGGDRPTKGRAGAPITLVIFSDFQCPYCREFAKSLDQVQRSNPGGLRVIYRNFPLRQHQYARERAEVGACIARQSNDAFWVYYDAMFIGPQESSAILEDAEKLVLARPDVDGTKLRSCISNHESARVVNEDLALANKYDIRSTPTVIMNGVLVPSRLTLPQTFSRFIGEKLVNRGA